MKVKCINEVSGKPVDLVGIGCRDAPVLLSVVDVGNLAPLVQLLVKYHVIHLCAIAIGAHACRGWL